MAGVGEFRVMTAGRIWSNVTLGKMRMDNGFMPARELAIGSVVLLRQVKVEKRRSDERQKNRQDCLSRPGATHGQVIVGDKSARRQASKVFSSSVQAEFDDSRFSAECR